MGDQAAEALAADEVGAAGLKGPARLWGSLLAPLRGCQVELAPAWPGWSLELDGVKLRGAVRLALEPGFHSLVLSGTLPGHVGEAPLMMRNLGHETLREGQDPLQALPPQALALQWPNGLRMDYYQKERDWAGEPFLSRVVAFPFLRVYERMPGMLLPCSLRFGAWWTPPVDGDWRVEASPTMFHRVRLDGRPCYDGFTNRAPWQGWVKLKAGRPVRLEAWVAHSGEMDNRVIRFMAARRGQEGLQALDPVSLRPLTPARWTRLP